MSVFEACRCRARHFRALRTAQRPSMLNPLFGGRQWHHQLGIAAD
jgi:hypothetical protein